MKVKRVRLLSWVSALLLVTASVAAGQITPVGAVSGAAFTTVNTAVDGTGNCKNGNPPVNCNIYTGKQFVWLNGGPSANSLSPDGQYFFAVLDPGGQPNPNDAAPKNLSCVATGCSDPYTNRTFTIQNGEICQTCYTGTHDSYFSTALSPNQLLIRLCVSTSNCYADTANPGGVYIMAICYLGSTGTSYPVDPRSCKYDAFKVQKTGQTQVSAVLSGMKYLDANADGQLDNGEAGIANWTISITCVACGHGGKNVVTTTTTDSSGTWTAVVQPSSSTGTTTFIIQEVLQAGWVETGNTVDQSMVAGGATESLSSFVYTVTIPNNAPSAVSMLDFGNINDATPPSCTLTASGTNGSGQSFIQVTVQDTGSGLKQVTVTGLSNDTVDVGSFQTGIAKAPTTVNTGGTTAPVIVTATKIDQMQSASLALSVSDLAGNITNCDPVDVGIGRDTGKPATATTSVTGPSEGLVHVYNGSPGVTSLTVGINGQTFHVNGLGAGQQATLDIRPDLVPGSNMVSITAGGHPGSTAAIVVADS